MNSVKRIHKSNCLNCGKSITICQSVPFGTCFRVNKQLSPMRTNSFVLGFGRDTACIGVLLWLPFFHSSRLSPESVLYSLSGTPGSASAAAGQARPFTLDQVLDGTVDSTRPRCELPLMAPLPPLAQIRAIKPAANNPEFVRIESPIMPIKRVPVKQAALSGPHVSFDSKPTGALGPTLSEF